MSHYQLPIMAHSQTSESIPLHTRPTLNPNAKEFVPAAAAAVRLSDFLQEGELVRLSIGTGHYSDGYPMLSVAMCCYTNHTFHVTECVDVPSLVGTSSEKPGTLLYEFIRGLKRAKKLRSNIRVSVWKHCYVKRNGAHISFNRLASDFLSSS